MRTLILFSLLAIVTACSRQEAPEPLTHAATPDVEWNLHGNDNGEQRFSRLDQINRESVKNLQLAWHFDIPTQRGVEATPLVVDGVMYVTGSWSVVHALDARTGQEIWTYDPKVHRSWLARGCCDAVNRGVAYFNGRVYFGAYDGRLIALNAKTGALEWEVHTTDQTQSYTITGAPRVAAGKVIIGNGGAEMGVRGYVSAYDSETGKMAWRFYTVPGNPEKGFETPEMEMAAKTWTGQWWKFGGGGTVWDSMAYDPELDLLYVGVGNGSPWNQHVRSPGGGDNLFLTSIVALRPATGEYVWHYQTAPGDSWDFTATQHMILADIEIEGELRKVIMQAPKNGFFYVLDRASGEFISAKPYTTVNWASSIDPRTGRPVETPNARLFDGKNISIPSNGGGHNWQPMSYNPMNGLVYIPTMVFPSAFKDPTREMDMKPNQGYWNTGFDRTATSPPKVPNVEEILDASFGGQLVAWDPVLQEPRWALEPGRPDKGGLLSTAGGLVFAGGPDVKFYAYDADTGATLWSFPTQSFTSAPPITYSIEGEQYIAVASGLSGGVISEGGVIFHHLELAHVPRVLVFKLGGTDQLPPLLVPEKTMPKPLPVTTSADVVEHGHVLYERHCGYCHGAGLRTGGVTPDLRWSHPGIHDLWQKIVIDGLFENAGMVSFRQFLTPDDAEAIRQYVLSEANRVYAIKSAAEAAGTPGER